MRWSKEVWRYNYGIHCQQAFKGIPGRSQTPDGRRLEKRIGQKTSGSSCLDREYGFKTFDEIVDYLKSGGAIGHFTGDWGEINQDNDVLIWKDEHVLRRTQRSDYDGINFWMGWETYTLDELKEWVSRFDDYRNEEGYISTSSVFTKNDHFNAKDVKEYYEIN